jgi:hypothetical protein
MIQTEREIVSLVVKHLKTQGFTVATEVADFHRSADVAAIDAQGYVVVIECKLNAIAKAIRQTRTHKLAADRVFVATTKKASRRATIERFRREGIGLIYVSENGDLEIIVPHLADGKTWEPANNRLRDRIKGRVSP